MNKRRFLAIALMVLFIPSFPGFGVANDNEVLLSRAETAFKQGNELLQTDPESAKDAYLSSVNYYNSIIESGISNAGLYYNLANAYIRLDETGNAILNYRKALLYSPNDSRIKYNLDYARSLQKKRFFLQVQKMRSCTFFFSGITSFPGCGSL